MAIISEPPPAMAPASAVDNTDILKVVTEGTLEIICLVFNSIAAIPSIEDDTLVIVTYCPGIPPWVLGVVTSKIFEPADIVLIGFVFRAIILLIAELFSFVFELFSRNPHWSSEIILKVYLFHFLKNLTRQNEIRLP